MDDAALTNLPLVELAITLVPINDLFQLAIVPMFIPFVLPPILNGVAGAELFMPTLPSALTINALLSTANASPEPA